MATLQCFLIPEELERVLKKLAAAKGLIGCRCIKGQYELINPLQTPSLFNWDDTLMNQLFLLPASQKLPNPLTQDAIHPRYMGWLHITPGELIQYGNQSVLTITTIQSEDKKDLPFKPSGWIRWLKHQLASSIVFGVEGVNIKFGGKSKYNDVGYSTKALCILKKGVIWKQYKNNNVVFYPLKNNLTESD